MKHLRVTQFNLSELLATMNVITMSVVLRGTLTALHPYLIVLFLEYNTIGMLLYPPVP